VPKIKASSSVRGPCSWPCSSQLSSNEVAQNQGVEQCSWPVFVAVFVAAFVTALIAMFVTALALRSSPDSSPCPSPDSSPRRARDVLREPR
jgi:hypothetical protein